MYLMFQLKYCQQSVLILMWKLLVTAKYLCAKSTSVLHFDRCHLRQDCVGSLPLK